MDDSVVEILPSRFLKKIERITDRNLARLGLQYIYFPFSSRRILSEVERFRPDIINLHNLHGGYFDLALLKSLTRIAPVVWTLHDMWAFTANAAYTFADDSWRMMRAGRGEHRLNPRVGLNWGGLLLRRKAEIYSQSDFTLVTPSRWLMEEAGLSPSLAGKRIVHIPNGIDLEKFSPRDKRSCRQELGIPDKAPVLMFGADILWKFGGILPRILREINRLTDREIHLLIVGNSDVSTIRELPKFISHFCGYIQDEEILARIYSASDLLIYPSKADNLPNVLVEAISCGTPCVTFDVGGCGEIIKNGISGRLILPFDIDSFARETLDLLFSSSTLADLSQKSRAYASANFSLNVMADNYVSLFHSIRKTT